MKANTCKCRFKKTHADCAFIDPKGLCTLLTSTKIYVNKYFWNNKNKKYEKHLKKECSFYKNKADVDKKILKKMSDDYNKNKYKLSLRFTKKIEVKKDKKTILGKDKNAEGLIKVLLEKDNTCISVNRYKDLIKKHKTEENFLNALYEKYGIQYSIRFVKPEEPKVEGDHGFYIIEKV